MPARSTFPPARHRSPWPALGLALAALLALGCGNRSNNEAQDGSHEVVVAGASDLVFVMKEIIPRFEAKTGAKVKFIPGSSGKLAAQIKEGAPFDVYFSANVRFVDDVIAAGSCFADTKALYARGRVVLWSVDEANLPASIEGMADPRYRKLAIANPSHAPYGLAAKQAMEKLGIWADVEKRLVYGSNIRDTMQFIESKNAEIGVIALSLAIKADGHYLEIPEDLHDPIDQALVVCKRGPSTELGRSFALFLNEPEIQQLMKDYGFAVPDKIELGATPE